MNSRTRAITPASVGILMFAFVVLAGVAFSAGSAQAAIVDSVTSGCISTQALAGCTTYTSPGTNTSMSVTLTGVDATKSFVVCSTRTANNAPSTALATCQLAPSGGNTTLTVAFGAAPGGGAQTVVQYYVAEFSAGVTVQRGAAVLANTTLSTTATLSSAVDCTATFLVPSTRSTDTNTTNDYRWMVRSVIGGIDGSTPAKPTCTAGTTSTVTFTRTGGSAGTTVTVEWQAVSYQGATVQRGAACIGPGATCPPPSGGTAGTNGGATLGTGVDTSKSFLLFTRRENTSVAGNEGYTMLRGEFTAAGASVTTLKFERATNSTWSTREVDVIYEVVALGDGSVVSPSGTTPTAMGSAATSVNSTTIVTVDPTRAVPFLSASLASSSLSATFERGVVNANAAGSASDVSDLTFTRGASGTAENIAWFTVSFFRCSSASGVSNDPLCTVTASTSAATVSASATIDWTSTDSVFVARSAGSPNSGTPANGTTYCTNPGAPDNCTTTLGSGTVVYPAVASPSPTVTTFTDSGLTIGSTYYYKVWAKIPVPVGNCNAAPCYVGGYEVAVTTRSDQSTVLVSGGAALNPVIAGVATGTAALGTNGGQILVLSNSSTSATVALSLPPITTVGAVQGYVSTFTRSDTGADTLVVADQSGFVYSIDLSTGLYDWQARLPATGVKAAATVWIRSAGSARMRAAYNNGSYDVIFVATANTLPAGYTNNSVYALRADTGAILWTFTPSTQTYTGVCTNCPMDQIEGQPFLDYTRDFLYVTSHGGNGGGQDAAWVLDVGASLTAPGLKWVAAGDDFSAGATLSGDGLKVYIGSTTGNLYTLSGMDQPNPQTQWQLTSVTVHNGVGFKGFIWEDFNPVLAGHLYWVTTDGRVIAYDQPAQSLVWQDTTAVNTGAAGCAGAGTNTLNQLLLGSNYLWVGACDGQINQYQLYPSTAPSNPVNRQFQVGDGTKSVGPMSTATPSSLTAELFATTGSAIYKVRLQPTESLP